MVFAGLVMGARIVLACCKWAISASIITRMSVQFMLCSINGEFDLAVFVVTDSTKTL